MSVLSKSVATAVGCAPIFIFTSAIPTPAVALQVAAPGSALPAVQAPTATTVESPEANNPICKIVPQACIGPSRVSVPPAAQGSAAPAPAEPEFLQVGEIKGESNDKGPPMAIEVLSISWGETSQGKNIRKRPSRASSDPEEGGEIIRNVDAMKAADSAGPAEPPPSGSATIVVARAFTAKGQHIPMAKITMRGRTYDLQEVDVSSCTDLANGTASCSLTYQSLGR